MEQLQPNGDAGEALRRAQQEAPVFADDHPAAPASAAAGPRVLSAVELLALDIPVREYVLKPILREKDTAMIHAWRGVGKTYVGLEIACAIAAGGTFLSWSAPRPRKALYLDGEMPARTMQERLAAIVRSREWVATLDPTNLIFVCADLQEQPLPSLATAEGQALVEPLVNAADVVVVDSISTLAGGGKENEGESWLPMQAWTLALRRRGKTVILLHHDGKGGNQRGTSRREDILDLVVQLRRPSDYEPRQGARFELHFEKARALHGEVVEPFEAALTVGATGEALWTTRKMEDAQLHRAVALSSDGCKPNDIADELKVSRATVYRILKRAREMGLLPGEQA